MVSAHKLKSRGHRQLTRSRPAAAGGGGHSDSDEVEILDFVPASPSLPMSASTSAPSAVATVPVIYTTPLTVATAILTPPLAVATATHSPSLAVATTAGTSPTTVVGLREDGEARIYRKDQG